MSIYRFLHKYRWPSLGNLLIVIVLVALLVPAVNRVRDAASRSVSV